MHLRENDNVEINIYNGEMVIKKIKYPKYTNLQERLEASIKTNWEIYVESTQEVDVGAPKGDEYW